MEKNLSKIPDFPSYRDLVKHKPLEAMVSEQKIPVNSLKNQKFAF